MLSLSISFLIASLAYSALVMPFFAAVSHLGDIRIKQITSKLKCEALVLRLSFVEQASRLEKKLLNIGNPVKFEEKIDGSTEFRHLTTDELNQVLAMIDAATIQQEQAA